MPILKIRNVIASFEETLLAEETRVVPVLVNYLLRLHQRIKTFSSARRATLGQTLIDIANQFFADPDINQERLDEELETISALSSALDAARSFGFSVSDNPVPATMEPPRQVDEDADTPPEPNTVRAINEEAQARIALSRATRSAREQGFAVADDGDGT